MHYDEQELRARVAATVIAPAEQAAFSGTAAEFSTAITAAAIVADEGRINLHRWITAGRRAGLSWTEVGATLGISKQAAQQRFGRDGEEPVELDEELEVVRRGAHAFNEVAMLETAGAKGQALTRVGAGVLAFRRTDQPWEHARAIGLTPDRAAESLGEGWAHVASWFPFHYFRRPAIAGGK